MSSSAGSVSGTNLVFLAFQREHQLYYRDEQRESFNYIAVTDRNSKNIGTVHSLAYWLSKSSPL